MERLRTRTDDGRWFNRVTKTRAKKLFCQGIDIVLCPGKMVPFGGWHVGCHVDTKRRLEDRPGFSPDGTGAPSTMPEEVFQHLVEEFEFYNCTCAETGHYTSFYVQEEPIPGKGLRND